jgi:hypothetical protein
VHIKFKKLNDSIYISVGTNGRKPGLMSTIHLLLTCKLIFPNNVKKKMGNLFKPEDHQSKFVCPLPGDKPDFFFYIIWEN